MSTIQAFLLGMIVAWTPSVIVLAWCLWRAGPKDLPGESYGITQPNAEAFPAEG